MQESKMSRDMHSVHASVGDERSESTVSVHGLIPCHQCDSPAVEQIRGEMGRGDYKEVQFVNHKGFFKDDLDFYKKVYLDDYNRGDFRVSCSDCDNATPWLQRDLQGLKDTGAEYTRKLWNATNSKPYPHRKIIG